MLVVVVYKQRMQQQQPPCTLTPALQQHLDKHPTGSYIIEEYERGLRDFVQHIIDKTHVRIEGLVDIQAVSAHISAPLTPLSEIYGTRLSYMCVVLVDLRIEILQNHDLTNPVVVRRVASPFYPIMRGSSADPDPAGFLTHNELDDPAWGYFLVDGTERVVHTSQRLRNEPHVRMGALPNQKKRGRSTAADNPTPHPFMQMSCVTHDLSRMVFIGSLKQSADLRDVVGVSISLNTTQTVMRSVNIADFVHFCDTMAAQTFGELDVPSADAAEHLLRTCVDPYAPEDARMDFRMRMQATRLHCELGERNSFTAVKSAVSAQHAGLFDTPEQIFRLILTDLFTHIRPDSGDSAIFCDIEHSREWREVWIRKRALLSLCLCRYLMVRTQRAEPDDPNLCSRKAFETCGRTLSNLAIRHWNSAFTDILQTIIQQANEPVEILEEDAAASPLLCPAPRNTHEGACLMNISKASRQRLCGAHVSAAARAATQQFVSLTRYGGIGAWCAGALHAGNHTHASICNIVESTLAQRRVWLLGWIKNTADPSGRNKGATAAKRNMSCIFERQNAIAQMAAIEVIKIPVEENSKTRAHRMVHGDEDGFLCPIYTVEGKDVGNKQMPAMTVCVSEAHPVHEIMHAVRTALPQIVELTDLRRTARLVLVNNCPIGALPAHLRSADAWLALVRARRAGHLYKDIGIVLEDESGCVRVCCDGNRFVRPLLDYATRELDWLDPAEQSCSVVTVVCPSLRRGRETLGLAGALESKHNIMILEEIDPLAKFSLPVALTSYADHQAPVRIMFACKMSAQGEGVISHNAWRLFLTQRKSLVYPQVPLTPSSVYARFGVAERPTSESVVIALTSADGVTEEDGILLNQDAVEGGKFMNRYVFVQRCELENDEHLGMLPGLCTQQREFHNVYGDPIDPLTNIVRPGTIVREDQCIIAKYKKYMDGDEWHVENTSVYVPTLQNGTVSAVVKRTVYDVVAQCMRTHITVAIAQTRLCEIGDKLVPDGSANKGTACAMRRAIDMPFDAEGCVPDVIMNPLSIAARMTIGEEHMLYAGLGVAYAGSRDGIDSTAFRERNIDYIGDILVKSGFQRTGERTLYSPDTGLPIQCYIHTNTNSNGNNGVFMGAGSMQSLRQKVAEKTQVRRRGAYSAGTGQAQERRCKRGGSRFGEQDVENSISHGASSYLSDRMMNCSDKRERVLCECGRRAVWQPDRSQHECPVCDSAEKRRRLSEKLRVPVPHIWTQFDHNITGLGFAVRNIPEPDTVVQSMQQQFT